jgi:hypothetical protein
MNKLTNDADKLAQAIVQYLKEALLIDARMNSERSVMSRTPTH